jgi:D-alanyl-D-alanine carboxypeptidase
MLLRRHAFSSGLVLWLAAVTPAQATPTARLEAWLQQQRAERGFPGTCAAVVLPDGVHAAATGFVDAAGKEPLTTGHRLLSGSIGKTYVAAVALQLVADEKLDLDGRLADLLGKEESYARLPNGKDVTLRQLLNHTSGIREHVWKPEFQRAVTADPDRALSPRECLAFALGVPPVAEPGAKWSYADTNYLLAGLAIEHVAGKPYYEVLQERVLAPLGLRDTLPSDRRDLPRLANAFASGVAFQQGWTVADGKYFVNPVFEWCGGGLYCTTADLARWCRALFDGAVIPEALRSAHLDGVPAARSVTERYGLGCFVQSTKHGDAFGHSGFMPGYSSCMLWYRDLKVAVALQYTTDARDKVGPLRRQLDEIAALVVDAEPVDTGR